MICQDSGPQSTYHTLHPHTIPVFPGHPVVSVFIRYPDVPTNTSTPTIQITALTASPPEAMAIKVERAEPIESACTLSMMQEVLPEEHEYREETGYGKKEQKGAFGLAMRRVSAKMNIGKLDQVAKSVGDVMTRPWSIGCGSGDADDAGDAGGEGKRIEIGRYLFEVKEDENSGHGGADGRSERAAGGSNVKKRGREGSCGGGKS